MPDKKTPDNRGGETTSPPPLTRQESLVDLEGSVDQILENMPSGSLSRAIGDSLYGINARNKQPALPRAKDQNGYIFFTKPLLRLEDENISNSRRFFSMLAADEVSYQRYVRLNLDPRLAYVGMKSPFVNPESAFIPLLTNSITNLSGFPDLQVATYTTPSGLYGEQNSWTDGPLNHHEVYELSATFRNTQGNPLIYLFTIWVYYQALVSEGVLNPYMDTMLRNEVDYQTRIYRVVTDTTNRYVTGICAPYAAFPISVPIGAKYDYSVEKPFNDSTSDINVMFRAIGFMFDEDIIKLEFNQVGAIFNNSIAAILKHDMENPFSEYTRREDPLKIYEVQGSKLSKVPHGLLALTEDSLYNNFYYNTNHLLIPYINLYTNELEWWAPSEIMNNMKGE